MAKANCFCSSTFIEYGQVRIANFCSFVRFVMATRFPLDFVHIAFRNISHGIHEDQKSFVMNDSTLWAHHSCWDYSKQLKKQTKRTTNAHLHCNFQCINTLLPWPCFDEYSVNKLICLYALSQKSKLQRCAMNFFLSFISFTNIRMNFFLIRYVMRMKVLCHSTRSYNSIQLK